MFNTQWKVLVLGISMFLVNLSSANAEEGRTTTVNPNQGQPVAGVSKKNSGIELQGELNRPQLQTRNPRYQLQKGDVIELDFPFVPSLKQILTVQPDGFVALRGIGDLHVEGKTVPELTELLRSAYTKILVEPVITVELKEFEKPYFMASGEVEHPGKYELRGDITMMQGLAVAGGFKDSAKASQVLLIRRASNEWVEVKQVNMKKMLQEASLSEDLHLQPGDMLYVPKNAMTKIKLFMPSMSLSPHIWGF